MSYLDAVMLAVAVAFATPALVLGVETLAACVGRRPRSTPPSGSAPSVVVLTPAHNEEGQIAATIKSVLPQLGEGDRMLVVADNCSDRTAEIAASLGAEVLVRHDEALKGKGYAIRHGLDALRDSPPEVVVVIDADCVAETGAIAQLAHAAARSNRPVQGRYEMQSPPDGTARASRVSEFAVRIKNYVRPLGLQRLGLPCLMTGSGMAFPWEALEKTPHPGSHIVEDMRFSTDLAIHGYPPKPCMQAGFVSWLPSVESAFTTQRTRWEHGHLATIRSEAPRLLGQFLRTCRPSSLALMLELSVPPLSLFVCFLAALTGAAALVGIATGYWLVFWALLGIAGFAVLGLGVAWLRFCRDVLPFREVLAIPGYVLKKLPIYRSFATGPEEGWVRTARDASLSGPHFDAEDHAPAKEPAAGDPQSR